MLIERAKIGDGMFVARKIIAGGKLASEHVANGLINDDEFQVAVARELATILGDDMYGGVFVARSDDGQIVGFVSYFNGVPIGRIGDIWVDEDYRGGTLAVKLCRKAEAALTDSGSRSISCAAMARDAKTISALMGLGYVPVATRFIRDTGEDNG